jgi:ribokinase
MKVIGSTPNGLLNLSEAYMLAITVVGSINMDIVVRVPHLPAPGETILGQDYHCIPGGKGANQAVAVARLGGTVHMVGKVGSDPYGVALRAKLSVEGINVEFVEIDSKSMSGIAMITVDEAGCNSIIVAPGANMSLTPDDVSHAFAKIGSMDVLVLQLESPLDCVMEAARLGKECGAKVVLNPAPARQLPREILKRIDVLVPNETETSLLTGLQVDSIEQAETAAHRLLEMGSGAVVVTLGGRGALVAIPGKSSLHMPAHPVQVVDTTAAGDAFVAGLAIGLAQGLNLIEATHLGNAAAAVSVTRFGAQPSMPTREDVMRFLHNL